MGRAQGPVSLVRFDEDGWWGSRGDGYCRKKHGGEVSI